MDGRVLGASQNPFRKSLVKRESLERKGIQGSLRQERGDGSLEGWPEKVHRDLRKRPCPAKDSKSKTCAQACGCKIMTPIWLQVAFQASQPLQGQEKNKSPKKKKGVSEKRKRGFLWQSLTCLKCNLEPNCGADLGVIILQPHACTSVLDFKSFAGRGCFLNGRGLSGRIESIWEIPSKEMLCKEACSAKKRALQRSVQRSVLCKGACSAKKRALQRSVLCKEERSAKKRALQKACSAKERALQRSAKKSALQRSVLCKEACSAEKSALQRRALCKEACSARKRALLRRVLCKERRMLCREERSARASAQESALQRSVLCRGECSAKKRPLSLRAFPKWIIFYLEAPSTRPSSI